jgi:hypothetical protein
MRDNAMVQGGVHTASGSLQGHKSLRAFEPANNRRWRSTAVPAWGDGGGAASHMRLVWGGGVPRGRRRKREEERACFLLIQRPHGSEVESGAGRFWSLTISSGIAFEIEDAALDLANSPFSI